MVIKDIQGSTLRVGSELAKIEHSENQNMTLTCPMCQVVFLELHSPLTNSSGLITEAGGAELELDWWTRLCREHKPKTDHLTYVYFLIAAYHCHVLFTIPNIYRQC